MQQILSINIIIVMIERKWNEKSQNPSKGMIVNEL